MNRMRDASISVAHAVHRFTHDYSYVDGIIAKYHNNPGLKRDIFQSYKLWSLVRILERSKPRKILEFGGGVVNGRLRRLRQEERRRGHQRGK